MRVQELEEWTRQILDRLAKGQPIEDQRVELKAEWPTDARRAARRIAAHGNAARSREILWIIGADEKAQQVTGAGTDDLASWWPKVQAMFDEGVSPILVMNVGVPYQESTVVALLFDVERIPFVVKTGVDNPGTEVPWRDGNLTRSIHRSELVSILLPVAVAPTFDCLGAHITLLRDSDTSETSFEVRADVYVYPRNRDRATIPFHLCDGEVVVQSRGYRSSLTQVKIAPDKAMQIFKMGLTEPRPAPRFLSHTILGASSEVLIDGPGLLKVVARGPYLGGTAGGDTLHVTLRFGIVDVSARISIDFDAPQTLLRGTSSNNEWQFNRAS